ncbi:luminal-binding protein-like [Triticum aestivum]|uniref:luminal-binding protein-like n=1 Tax=Triticum aestivum TaxID=4565 RepID=UPI001D01C23F|nr:luminal-binding protein-like [Triticum aestivum]
MASSRLALGVVLLLVAAASGAAAFRTGNTTAIHIGNTKACIAGYGGLEDPGLSYKLCIPSWVAFTPNGTLFGEAALNHAAVSPGTAVSGFKRVLGSKYQLVFFPPPPTSMDV